MKEETKLQEICIKCNSKDIIHKTSYRRTGPPEGWVRKPMDFRKISWGVYLDIYTCSSCGHINKIKR